jgi:hypothetical protein
VGGRPSGKDSSHARAEISHGCGGRVEEEEGGAAGVNGCGGVGFGGVAGAVPPGGGLGGGTARGRGRAAARPAGERAAGGWPGAPAFAAAAAAAAAEVRVSRCGGDLMGFAVLGCLRICAAGARPYQQRICVVTKVKN